MDVMTALLLSFTIGLGLSYIDRGVLHEAFSDFQKIITKLIEAVIIPLLPLHIFGIFLNMTVSGQVMSVITMFLKVIIVIFVLHVLLLLIQFTVAGSVSGKNPLRLLKNNASGLCNRIGDTVLSRHHPCNIGTGGQERSTGEHRDLCHSPLCHYPSGRQHDEDHRLCDGNHVYVR